MNDYMKFKHFLFLTIEFACQKHFIDMVVHYHYGPGKLFIFRGNAYSICVHQNGLKCFCSWAPQKPPTFPPQDLAWGNACTSQCSFLATTSVHGGQRLDRLWSGVYPYFLSLSPSAALSPLVWLSTWTDCIRNSNETSRLVTLIVKHPRYSSDTNRH